MSANTILENTASGTTIGTFSSTDIDSTNIFTYTLVSGTGDDDNTSFNLVGNELQSIQIFDFETQSSYSIRVQTEDIEGATLEQIFIITIINDNDPTTIGGDISRIGAEDDGAINRHK